MDYSLMGMTVSPELKEAVDERVKNVDLIGGRLLPEKSENSVTGKMNKILAQNDGGADADGGRRAPGAGYNRVQPVFGEDTWSTSAYGIEAEVETHQLLLMQATMIDLQMVQADIAVDTLLCNREKRIVEQVFSPSVFTGTSYHALTHGLNNASCDIVAEINTQAKAIRARTKISKNMLSLFCNDQAFEYMKYLLQASDIKLTMNVTTLDDNAFKSLIAAWLGVKEVVVGYASYSSAGLANANVTYSELYPTDFMMLCYVSPAGATWGPGLGRQPVFTPFTSDYIFDTYTENRTLREIVRCQEWRGIKIDTKYGVLIGNCEE